MELLEKVREKWADLSRTKKSVILVGITCLVLSTYLFYRWATKVDYAPLFTNMQAESAGKIAENLKALNVTYKLGDAGKTILVPKDQVYELRLDLASKGVMSDSSYGFELFDKAIWELLISKEMLIISVRCRKNCAGQLFRLML